MTISACCLFPVSWGITWDITTTDRRFVHGDMTWHKAGHWQPADDEALIMLNLYPNIIIPNYSDWCIKCVNVSSCDQQHVKVDFNMLTCSFIGY